MLWSLLSGLFLFLLLFCKRLVPFERFAPSSESLNGFRAVSQKFTPSSGLASSEPVCNPLQAVCPFLLNRLSPCSFFSNAVVPFDGVAPTERQGIEHWRNSGRPLERDWTGARI